MSDRELLEQTARYVDSIFGAGEGEKHIRFLDRIRDPALREIVHRYHQMEADTSEVSLEENYLIGMCVSCATRNFDTAQMFAKTLLHLGTRPQKVRAALGRLAMWVGGLPAVEASFAIERALREYETDPKAALAVWFPEARK